jgi:FKBP-type peptidyl-prolyl cis-trans isomerase FklB
MKKSILLLPILFGMSLGYAQKKAVKNVNKTLSEDQKASYFIGLNIAESMKKQGFKVDVNLLAQAMKDELAGRKTLLPKEEMQKFMSDFSQKQQAKAMEVGKIKAEENKKIGAEFMLKNKSNSAVKTTASGLQYEVLTAGDGINTPKGTDIVSVLYTGKLLDGTVFDSSEKQGGKPVDVPLNNVIKGWTEGVQLMSKGSKYRLYIPSDLAYGDNGGGNVIPPGATLIFDIELINFKAPEAQKIESVPAAK